jgi:site-specific DNA-methyltransferase (adenine-specific)
MWIYGTGFPKSLDVSKAIDRELDSMGSYGGPKSDAHAGWIARGRMRGEDGHAGFQRPWMQDEQAVDRAARQYLAATDAARQWQGWGTALKPAWEPVILARKPLSEKTVAANVLRWGTGALNIDVCRVETAENPSGKRRDGKAPGREIGTWANDRRSAETFAQQRAGEAIGRWPANVVHDGSEEVVGMFPQTAPSSDRKRVNRATTQFEFGDGKPEGSIPSGHADSGSAARFFYCPKASKADRAGSKHPTVKPVTLMRWLCKLVTPPGGLVLDPFAGSGTTGLAAVSEGFSAILCEAEDEYVADMRNRFGRGIE